MGFELSLKEVKESRRCRGEEGGRFRHKDGIPLFKSTEIGDAVLSSRYSKKASAARLWNVWKGEECKKTGKVRRDRL